MPVCSIVIPWHRNFEDLTRAVESVLVQSLQDFEIIVVANGVDDATYARAAALFDDPRYRTERLGIAGASHARNHGLALARGELVFFLDADDLFLPGKLERIVEIWRDEPFDVAFSRGIRHRGAGVSWAFPVDQWDHRQPIGEFFFCDGCTISTSAIVIATEVRDRLRFHPDCGSYEDPDLIIRAAAMGLAITMVPDTLYQWSDDRVGDRLSQLPNYAERLAWADRLGDALTPRALAAYRARCVAQHDFPRNPLRNLGFMWSALRLGAISPRETAMFVGRGLLPASLQRSMLNLYFRIRSRSREKIGDHPVDPEDKVLAKPRPRPRRIGQKVGRTAAFVALVNESLHNFLPLATSLAVVAAIGGLIVGCGNLA